MPMSPSTAAWCQSEAFAAWGSGPKGQIACDALALTVSYLDRPPVGWNSGDDINVLKERCRNHLKTNYKPKPVGFLPAIGLTWLFYIFLESVISWAIEKALERKFGNG